MWGAVIGDLAGSVYEYQQTKEIKKVQNIDSLITDESFFSDDTILTMAVLESVMTNSNYDENLKKYGKLYQDYRPDFNPYFKSSFSPNFCKWLDGDFIGTSNGNGAMMRISPVGYLFNDEDDVVENALLATRPSHNSIEAINYAKMVALIIFYARNGLSKDEIIEKLNIKYSYKPFLKFNTTCGETINNCLYALFETDNFEKALKLVISFGGDTDTNACIVGSMAEALYEIPDDLILEAQKHIPDDFTKKLKLAYKKIK